jgi:hypothetical protein
MYLMGVYLMGVHLMGVHLMGVSLIGVYSIPCPGENVFTVGFLSVKLLGKAREN